MDNENSSERIGVSVDVLWKNDDGRIRENSHKNWKKDINKIGYNSYSTDFHTILF
jgi:hypothetical protein